MRFPTGVVALLCSLFCVSVFANVAVLDKDNFAATVPPEGGWFIKFYAPWCGHCKSLAPVWDELGDIHENIGKVDCTQSGGLCSLFGVRGYPTLIYLINGRQYPYRGKRNLESFSDFIEGGYTSVESAAIPDFKNIPSGTDVEQAMTEAYKIILEWIGKNPSYAMAAVFGVFVLSGCIFGILLQICLQPSPPKKKRPTETPKANEEADNKEEQKKRKIGRKGKAKKRIM